jgi:hypothetical protein
MTIFETDSRHAFTSGVLAITGCLLLTLALGTGLLLLPITVLSFLIGVLAVASLVLAGGLMYQLYGLLNTTYTVDRNAFVIRVGAARHIVPMSDVVQLIRASALGELKLARVPLAGWWIGRTTHPEFGPIRFFATAPPKDQFVVVTNGGSYAVSPYDSELFVQTFLAQQSLEPTKKITATSLLPPLLDVALWKDKAARSLLILGIAINLLMFGISIGRFPTLPPQLVLHFNASGIADRFGSTSAIFAPPLIASLLFAVNFLIGLLAHRRGEHLAGYLVWGGNVAVQLAFLVATITIGFMSGLT